MVGAGDNQEFFIVASEKLECVFPEVAGVGLLAVDDEYGAFELVGVFKEFEIHERKSRGGVPSIGGIARTGVKSAGCLVVVVVSLDKLRSVVRKRVDNASGPLIFARAEVFGAALGQCGAGGIALGFGVVGIEVAVGCHASHIVHRRSNSGFDSRVVYGRLDGDASPTADSENAYAPGIDKGVCREEVNCGREVLRIDVGRRHSSGPSSAFACERGVESEGDEAAFGKPDGIQPRALLLYGAEGAADCYRREFALRAFGDIHVGGEGDAVSVDECDLDVVNFGAFREDLVPFLRKDKLFGRCEMSVGVRIVHGLRVG